MLTKEGKKELSKF
jgi:protein phosphatase PTC2/3